MEEVHNKHNIWLLRASRDTAVNLHLSHDTLATVNSLSTHISITARSRKGVLVPESKHQHAVAFTHKCTHTHISRRIHLHMHDTYRDEHTQTCTSTFLTHLEHSIAAIRLDHMLPHLSVSERTSQRDQNKRVEAASSKMMDHSKLYRLTCSAIWLAVFFLTRPCHLMMTSTDKNMKMDLIATLNTLMCLRHWLRVINWDYHDIFL